MVNAVVVLSFIDIHYDLDLHLFSKDNKTRFLLFCDLRKKFGYCKRLKTFILLVIQNNMDTTICSHGECCTKGFL